MEMKNVSGKRKVTGQHAIVIVLALIAAYFGGSYMGWWGGSEPAPIGDNSDILNAIGGIKGDIKNVTAEQTKQAADIAALNKSAMVALPVTVSTTSQQPLVKQLVAETPVSATKTMDDQALEQARQMLADAENLYESAQVADDNMDDAIDDEDDSDVEDIKDDAKDIVDDSNDLRDDAKKLQDKLRASWPSEVRNNTAKNIALRTLDSVRSTANDAKKDANDVIGNADKFETKTTPTSDAETEKLKLQIELAKAQSAIGQQASVVPVTTGVAGYQSQTGGL